MTPDVGRKVDTRLSWKYDGKDPGQDPPGAVCVVIRMAVERATGHAAQSPAFVVPERSGPTEPIRRSESDAAW